MVMIDMCGYHIRLHFLLILLPGKIKRLICPENDFESSLQQISIDILRHKRIPHNQSEIRHILTSHVHCKLNVRLSHVVYISHKMRSVNLRKFLIDRGEILMKNANRTSLDLSESDHSNNSR